MFCRLSVCPSLYGQNPYFESYEFPKRSRVRESYFSINEVRFYEVVRCYGQRLVRIIDGLGRGKLGHAHHIIFFFNPSTRTQLPRVLTSS